MTHKDFDEYLLSYPNTWLDFPFGEGKLFAIITDDSKPLRISLKCDPQLALNLREKYESIVPGYHLNKKHWNTVIYTGQLSDDEIKDLIRHSYELVKATA